MKCPPVSFFYPNCISRKQTCQMDVVNRMESTKDIVSEIPCHNGRSVNLKGRCIMDSQGLKRTSHIDGGYLNQKAVHFKRGYVFKRPRTSFVILPFQRAWLLLCTNTTRTAGRLHLYSITIYCYQS